MGNEKVECKHIWKKVFVRRAMSTRDPEHFDQMITGLYCPKCLTTKQLVFEINRLRTKNKKTNQKLYQAYQKGDNFDKVKINLSKLGYNEVQIASLIKTLLDAHGAPEETMVTLISSALQPEHKLMTKQIYKNVLL